MEFANILGVRIDKISINDTIKIFKKNINKNKKIIIANHNLHSAYINKYDNEFRRFYELADYIHADGVSLIYLAKLFGYDFELINRITYIDWLPYILEFINYENKKLFYLGGEQEVVKKARRIIFQSYQDINLQTHHGFFEKNYGSKENQIVREKINDFSPNILMVGMGMPIQEKWILENYEDLNVDIILSCGACFDYLTGKIKTPPRKLSKVGIEWIFRFIDEPKRLFKRYFIEPFFLIPDFLNDLKRIRKNRN